MPNEYEQPVEPMSRTEDLLRTGTEEPVIAMSELEKILRGEHIDRPHSRVADLLLQYNPSDILIEKSITENGTYYATADNADGYYKVVVDTPVIPPTVLDHLVETITTNGQHTYNPTHDGFSDATINVNVSANVNEHDFPTNGVFNSSVYGLDGFNKAVVTMQTAAVRSAILNATQNGTYMPSSLAEEIILRTTIPDETETGVTANESLSNYDILRITFTNKTTGVAGSRDIYPGNITYRSSNISFYERTIFVGDDADHYITLASTQANIYVLQKGYNITNMILIKKAGFFSKVDVNLPDGTNIEY